MARTPKPPTPLDARVDQYISNAAEFAQPVLVWLRDLMHATCPGLVEELKWGKPHFGYAGMFAGMAAFKRHCVFGFWKHELMLERQPELGAVMKAFERLTSCADLPTKKDVVRCIKLAMQLNEAGVKVVRKKQPKSPLRIPSLLTAALAKNRKAREAFKSFSPSHQREYAEWIAEAKAEATRQRRLATALEWLAEGKHRNWKYERC